MEELLLATYGDGRRARSGPRQGEVSALLEPVDLLADLGADGRRRTQVDVRQRDRGFGAVLERQVQLAAEHVVGGAFEVVDVGQVVADVGVVRGQRLAVGLADCLGDPWITLGEQFLPILRRELPDPGEDVRGAHHRELARRRLPVPLRDRCQVGGVDLADPGHLRPALVQRLDDHLLLGPTRQILGDRGPCVGGLTERQPRSKLTDVRVVEAVQPGRDLLPLTLGDRGPQLGELVGPGGALHHDARRLVARMALQPQQLVVGLRPMRDVLLRHRALGSIPDHDRAGTHSPMWTEASLSGPVQSGTCGRGGSRVTRVATCRSTRAIGSCSAIRPRFQTARTASDSPADHCEGALRCPNGQLLVDTPAAIGSKVVVRLDLLGRPTRHEERSPTGRS